MSKKRRMILPGLVLVVGLTSQSWATSQSSGSLETHVDLLGAYGFSGSILVIQGEDILAEGTFGWADAERGIRNAPDTVFAVASITKQLTAAAVLLLEQQKKLRLEDPVSRFFPGAPADKAAMTLRQLLEHRSGLAFECTQNAKAPNSQAEFLACLWRQPLEAPSGSRDIYSNQGYALLAAVIESASGKPYPDFLHEVLFQPAEMNDSGFLTDASRWPDTRVARQYTWEHDWGTALDSEMNWNLRGSADLVTTARDLWRWIRALEQGKVLGPAARQVLKLNPTDVPADGRQKEGLCLAGTMSLGFNSQVCRFSSGVSAIVLSNANFGYLQATPRVIEVLKAVLADPRRDPGLKNLGLPDEGFEVAGTYRLEEGGELLVQRVGDRLKIAALGQEAVNVLTVGTEAQRRELGATSEKTAKFLDRLRVRDFEGVSRVLDGRQSADAVQSTYGGWLERLEEQYGRLKKVRIVGTVPQGDSRRTVAELQFESGQAVRRFRWQGGELTSILEGWLPLVPTYFLRVGEEDFRGYHLAFGVPVQLRFDKSPDRVITRLQVKSGESDWKVANRTAVMR